MSFVLINGPWIGSKKSNSEQANEPLHVLCLASALEEEGIDCSVVDYLLDIYSEEHLHEILTRDRPRAVGVSSYTTNFSLNLEIARAVKRFDSTIPVIFGGPHPSVLPESVMENEGVDAVCVGEGERTVVEYYRALEGGIDMASVDGLVWRRNGGLVVNQPRKTIPDLDVLPFPARHKIPMDRYYYGFWGRKSSLMMAGRGCPYHCSFCAAHSVFADTRFRSPARVVDEMELVMKEYNCTAFTFNDDTFTLKDRWINEFLGELERRELDIIWKCFSRVNRVSRSMLERMYNTGCRSLLFGIESGSEEILDKVHKHIVKDGVRDAIRWSSEIGIETNGNFILGFPWDTRETMRETIDFALELPLSRTMFNIATPYPKTGLWEWAIENGVSEKDLYAFDTYLQGFGGFLAEGLEEIFTFDYESVSRKDIVDAFKYATVHSHFRYALRELWHVPRMLKRFTHNLFTDRLGFLDSIRATIPSTKIFVYYVLMSLRRKRGLRAKARFLSELLGILFTPRSRIFSTDKK